MVSVFRAMNLCLAALQVFGMDDLHVDEDCFFDSVSATALSLLQKSATLVGMSGRPETKQQAVSMPAAPLLRSLVVPLQKRGIRKFGSGFLSATVEDMTTSFHVGKISVGNPSQQFDVLFDTSSMYSWLAHAACDSSACKSHRQYSPLQSSTGVDVNQSGDALDAQHRLVANDASREEVIVRYTQSDLGDGDMTSWFVRDSVCLGKASIGEACVDMALATAVKLDEKPFRSMPQDGIIGLSLEGVGTSHKNSFLGQLFESAGNVLPQFGIWLGKDGGEVHLGGHELADLAGPLHWFPVHRPEDGYWQVEIQAVRVGDTIVNDCSRGCHGIVDTGVSHLGVQAALLPAIQDLLTPRRGWGGSCSGPDLSFDLGNFTLKLHPQDYAGDDCSPHLGALDLEEPFFNGVFAFGATVLQRYYAAFDWSQQKLGFAPLSSSPIQAGNDVPRSMRGATIV